MITYHRKNMKAFQLSKADEYYLKQRNEIATLLSLLKERYHLVTNHARNVEDYLAGIISLCAYQIGHQNKPTIQIMKSLAQTGFRLN